MNFLTGFVLTLGVGFLFLFLIIPSSQAATVSLEGRVSICGNSIVETGESCDGAGGGGSCGQSECRSNCTCTVCGDGVKEGNEQCELDSECSDGKTCNSSCECAGVNPPPPPPPVCEPTVQVGCSGCFEGEKICTYKNPCRTWQTFESCSVCGNNNIESPETCDDGNIAAGDGCSINCQIEGFCGDTIIDPGETCDDGNLDDGDGCNHFCEIEEGCGDGNLDAGEICDDGNLDNGDGCDSNCTATACGNGIATFSTGETCDDGNTVAGDGCSDSCQLESCGNGILNSGEACDDGNTDLTDTCDTQGTSPNTNGPCTITFCGDGIAQATIGEQCDDGNNLSDDGCSATCQLETACGNGIVEGTEQCDPPGVGCSSACQIEFNILNHQVSNITVDSARIDWITNLSATSILSWSKDDGTNAGSVENLSGSSLNYTITGLDASTRYNYTIVATRNSAPFDQDSRQGSFVTLFIDQCGDGICTGSETHQTCPLDCVEPCIPNYAPGPWSECVNGIQTRDYTDLNNCPYAIDPPPTVRSCDGGVVCGACQTINLSTLSCDPVWPCCGDRICEATENVLNCPVDCGISPTFRLGLPECLDGIDNDNDGFTDYPLDNGCSSPSDDSELSLTDFFKNVAGILDNKKVEEINEVIKNPAIAIVAINSLASFSFFNFFSYLRYLFGQPVTLIARRRRKKWGTVYNSLTKQPIDLAIVRLYQKDNGRLVESRVTDKQGRYNFIANPGRYYLTVTKPDFTFPTLYLKDKKEDAKYLDLYHGQTVDITHDGGIVVYNVPIDPKEDTSTPAKIIFQHYARKVQYAIAFSSVPFAAFSLAISPSLLTGALLIFHSLLFVLFRRLGYARKPKSWGVVYDKADKKPVGLVITRIYDKQYNKLLESRVTDARGRYAFLVDKNIYTLTAEKIGYKQSKVEDLDLKKNDREAIVDINIGLQKGEGAIGESDISEATSSIVSIQKEVEDLEASVGRESLEELLKSKESVLEIKKEIDEEQESLGELEQKVEDIQKDIDARLPAPEGASNDEQKDTRSTQEILEEAKGKKISELESDKKSPVKPAEPAPPKPKKSIFG